MSIDNVELCAFKVMMWAANVNPEFDNLGSSLVLGDDAASWDLAPRKHSKGYLAIADRMTDGGRPNIDGLVVLKFGV